MVDQNPQNNENLNNQKPEGNIYEIQKCNNEYR